MPTHFSEQDGTIEASFDWDDYVGGTNPGKCFYLKVAKKLQEGTISILAMYNNEQAVIDCTPLLVSMTYDLDLRENFTKAWEVFDDFANPTQLDAKSNKTPPPVPQIIPFHPILENWVKEKAAASEMIEYKPEIFDPCQTELNKLSHHVRKKTREATRKSAHYILERLIPKSTHNTDPTVTLSLEVHKYALTVSRQLSTETFKVTAIFDSLNALRNYSPSQVLESTS